MKLPTWMVKVEGAYHLVRREKDGDMFSLCGIVIDESPFDVGELRYTLKDICDGCLEPIAVIEMRVAWMRKGVLPT